MDEKCYIITYQAKRIEDGDIVLWNELIKGSPVKHIINVYKIEHEMNMPLFEDFILLNAIEIDEGDYWAFKDNF